MIITQSYKDKAELVRCVNDWLENSHEVSPSITIIKPGKYGASYVLTATIDLSEDGVEKPSVSSKQSSNTSTENTPDG